MARQCEVTGRKKMFGQIKSHSNRKTKHARELNLFTKRYFVAKLGERVALRVCTRAMRTIDKFGTLEEYLKRTPNDQLTPKMIELKKRIHN